jgi:hypothetical protein
MRLDNLRGPADHELKSRYEANMVLCGTEQVTARPSITPSSPPKKPLTADSIDPRLVHAQPNQYVSPNLSGTLTVAEDHYYRYRNCVLDEYLQTSGTIPSWRQQLQQAAMPSLPNRPTYPISGRVRVYEGQPLYLASSKLQASMYVEDLGHRQDPLLPEACVGNTRTSDSSIMLAFAQPVHESFDTATATHTELTFVGPPSLLHGVTFVDQSSPHRQQSLQQLTVYAKPTRRLTDTSPFQDGGVNTTPLVTPAIPVISPNNDEKFSSAVISASGIAHLEGNQWTEAVEKRVQEFKLLSQREKAQKILHLHQIQHFPDAYLQPSSPKRLDISTQPLASHKAAPMFDCTATENAYQPPQSQPPRNNYQQQHHQVKMQIRNGPALLSFTNHPGFSNIRSTFPRVQYGLPTNTTPVQEQTNVRLTRLPIETDLNWK